MRIDPRNRSRICHICNELIQMSVVSFRCLFREALRSNVQKFPTRPSSRPWTLVWSIEWLIICLYYVHSRTFILNSVVLTFSWNRRVAQFFKIYKFEYIKKFTMVLHYVSLSKRSQRNRENHGKHLLVRPGSRSQQKRLWPPLFVTPREFY